MFTAGDDIDDKFNDMPMTWGQVWTTLTNDAIMQLQPLLSKINELANDDNIQSMISGTVQMLGGAASAGAEFIDVLAGGAGFVAEYWSVIEPVIMVRLRGANDR